MPCLWACVCWCMDAQPLGGHSTRYEEVEVARFQEISKNALVTLHIVFRDQNPICSLIDQMRVFFSFI